MDKQRIIFESSPAYILLCLLVGAAYAFFLYSKKDYPWSKLINWILLGVRGLLAFFLAFLLLGPIIKQVNNILEKPLFVFLKDNSGSIQETVDSTTLKDISTQINSTRNALTDEGYQVVVNNLSGEDDEFDLSHNASSSDLQGALRYLSNKYEGRKLAGVLLVSDGIYNSGLSPLYSTYNFPVYTIGVGDTSKRKDIAIKHVAFNKIAYQGNRFPVRAEILVSGFPQEKLNVSLSYKGKVIERLLKDTGQDGFLSFDFQPLADEKGIQRYDVQVETFDQESNKRNNHATLFVEVVEGKKKILIAAPSPHPDIKALHAVIEKNSNYEVILHIPGVTKVDPRNLEPKNIDLAIFHQAPDRRGKTRSIVDQFVKSKKSMFVIMGRASDFSFYNGQNVPLRLETSPRDFDDVTPVINSNFSHFVLNPDLDLAFSGYPPVSIPFARVDAPLGASVLLYQRIGSLTTDKPLLSITDQNERKVAFLLGEGIWRWRLDEFDRTEKSEFFDGVFGKLIQYLTTNDEKKKFKSSPTEQEFSDSESVVFESQVYNDIFEPVYGNTVDIVLTDEAGKRFNYNYVLSPGNSRYEIGDLEQGVYQYQASTEINGKKETVRGQFAVIAKMTEIQNLTADFDLLRKLSTSTGGQFYSVTNIDQMKQALSRHEAQQIIRSEETYESLINLKGIFWVLIVMVSLEWFLRKFYGSY